jgi:hypothetical protein
VEYNVGGVVYRRESILTAEEVKKRNYEWCLWKILSRFLIIE